MEINLKPPEINLNLPVAYKKNVVYSADEIAKRGEHVLGDWVADVFIYTFFFTYLVKKYKSRCFYDTVYIDIEEIKNAKKYGTYKKLEEDNNATYKFVGENIARCLYHNPDTEFVIIPLVIQFSCGTLFNGSHMNLLIYRVQENKIEHFEPNGSFFTQDHAPIIECYEIITNEFKKLIQNIEEGRFQMTHFKTIISQNQYASFTPAQLDHVTDIYTKYQPIRIQLIQLNELYPGLGLQIIEGLSSKENVTKGYCAAWCMFYAELVFKNPELDGNSILNLLLEDVGEPDQSYMENNWNDYFRNVIKGYVLIIEDKVQDFFKKVYNVKITLNQIIDIRRYDRGNEKGLPSAAEMMEDLNEYIRVSHKSETNKKNKKERILEYFQKITPVSARLHDFDVKHKSYRSLEELDEYNKLVNMEKVKDTSNRQSHSSKKQKISPILRASKRSASNLSSNIMPISNKQSIVSARKKTFGRSIRSKRPTNKRDSVKNSGNIRPNGNEPGIVTQPLKQVLSGKTRKKTGIGRLLFWRK